MAHPLDDPKLYKRCVRLAMSLCRNRHNRIDEALDIVQDGYILAIRFMHQWDSKLISWEMWVMRKVRDAWRKWVEKRSMLKRSMIHTMIDELIRDEDGEEAEPEIPVRPRQENIVYFKERVAQQTPFERYKLAEELGNNGEIYLRNYHPGADRGSNKRWDVCETTNRCEPDLWAKQQIARCDLRRARQNRTGARLAFA